MSAIRVAMGKKGALCSYTCSRAFVLAALLFSSLTVGQPLTPVQATYVYELTSKKGRVNYIFGTSHVAPSTMPIYIGQCVKHVIKMSGQIYLEADQLATRYFLLSQPKTIAMSSVMDHLDLETTNGLSALIYGNSDSENITKLQNLDALSVVNFVISKIPDHEKILGLPDYGVDAELSMTARHLDIPLDYVESPEEQFSFFKKISAAEFSEVIEKVFTLVHNDAGAKKYQQSVLSMLLHAAKGNEKQLLQAMEIEGFVAYNRKTILDRNENLTNKVIDFINNFESKANFVAIGAAHLPGEFGVVERLISRGIRARRICG